MLCLRLNRSRRSRTSFLFLKVVLELPGGNPPGSSDFERLELSCLNRFIQEAPRQRHQLCRFCHRVCEFLGLLVHDSSLSFVELSVRDSLSSRSSSIRVATVLDAK